YLGENNMFYDFQENPVNLEHIAEKFGAKYVVSGNIAALRAKKGLDLFKIPFFSFGFGFKLNGKCSLSTRIWSTELKQVIFENSLTTTRKTEFLAIIQSYNSVLAPARKSCISNLFHQFIIRLP
ncbi:MAG: hypothetical protein PHQ23_07310, partial [Candidatus Wallbacteria bacterium]|nr:hypothetical protein [Candidatus Wallbacteria bacterium]